MNNNAWFTIDTSYTPNGIDITLFDTPIHLSPKDVCYLLCEVDVLATHLDPPLQTIPIGLPGYYIEVTAEQWMYFFDALLSAVGEVGWNANCCGKPKKWLEDLVRQQS